MKENHVKLYNLIFPIWILWLIPTTWVVVLPLNFIIDMTVVMLTMKHLKIQNMKKNVKSVILKVWIFGFIADFIGTLLMFSAILIDFNYETPFGKWWYDNISSAVSYDPFKSIFALLWVTISIVITAFFIYLFNYKICFKKSNLGDFQ
ncbi:hypothetical protein CG709_03480, partial [Lachnotalea glycerini]